MLLQFVTSLFLLAPSPEAPVAPMEWKAGTASAAITPEQSMWMAGYASRERPSEGKVHDLHAKALALEDSQGKRLVIITLDLIGITRSIRDELEREVKERFDLAPEGLLINASHTHSGPELRESKASLYGLPSPRVRQSQEYVLELKKKIIELMGKALKNLAPARLSSTRGRAGFAMNRRLKTARGVLNQPNPEGPVDHDVPVLRVEGEGGNLRAIIFGYACHNTTLSFYRFCGDYAGFAQEYLEESHPGATALFLAGCGADQNPQPRRSLDLAKQHGRALANGVEAALLYEGKPVRGPLRLGLEEVQLELIGIPSRKQLEGQSKSEDKYLRRRARRLLEEMEKRGELSARYPYLVQVALLGEELILVALAGEVVVGYSLRLKQELAGPAVWVAAYSNDVFGYVPTLQVLTEGGYEGGGAIRFSTLPGPFAPSVEEAIVGKVHQLIRKLRGLERFVFRPAREQIY